MSGMLAPTLKEKFLGFVEIRKIFSISKIGKVAGCYVTEGMIKRGSKVRLLRDNVVVHEGKLQSLQRFKNEVAEVNESYECGIVLHNYDDIREKDIIECFEIESVSRQI
jgi:translation initiation factor IF-2